jgi:hypothetical protein
MTTPRAILGVSTFHSLYWIWYAVDFMPAVNQSPLEHLHIDPVVGYVGVFAALFFNMGAAMYPGSLISKIGIKDGQLCIFTHSFPTMTQSQKGVAYDFEHVSMDPSTKETQDIVNKGDLQEYRGIVALKAEGRRLPYLLQFGNHNEVIDSWMLLQCLLNPSIAKKEIQRGYRTSSGEREKPRRGGESKQVRKALGGGKMRGRK